MNTLCKQAHELITARQVSYGDMVSSWKRIASSVNRRTNLNLSAEDALWVLIEMKLRRDLNSPDNPDHLRDAIGYLGILGQVRAEQASQKGARLKTVREEFEELKGRDLP